MERVHREAAAIDQLQNGGIVEGLSPGIDVDDRHQHQGRAGHSVEEEFDGGVNSAPVAPDADQEVHRNQAHFPEHEEQKKIHRQEHAYQPELEQQQQRIIHFLPRVDMLPGNEHGQGREERGKQDKPNAQAIRYEVKVDVRLRDPEQIGFHRRTCQQPQRSGEDHQREGQRGGPCLAIGYQQDEDEPDQRRESEKADKCHRDTAMNPMVTIRTMEPHTTQVA